MLFLMIALFSRPFICSPAFPGISRIYSALLLLILVAWIALKGLSLSDHKTRALPILCFIGILLISLILAENKAPAVLALTHCVSGLLLMMICLTLPHNDKNKIIGTLIASGVCVSFLAAYQYFFGFQNILNYLTANKISNPYAVNYIAQKRVYYPFITPNALGGYLIMIIPIALSLPRQRWLMIPLTFALFLTGSVGALTSLLLAMMVYFILKNTLPTKTLWLFLSALILISLVVFLRMQTADPSFQPLFSLKMRLNYWHDTLLIIKAHFWTGVGLGNFDSHFSRYSHNTPLQLWAETGVFGILSFILLITHLLKSGLTAIRNAPDKIMGIGLMSAACAFLIHNLMDFTYFLPELSLTWWAILGLLSNRSPQSA